MNYTLNKEIQANNLKLFKLRFANLYDEFSTHIDLFSSDPEKFFPTNLEILESKSKAITVKENGTFLHSSYSPSAEAQKFSEQLFSDSTNDKDVIVFHGFGLGYSVIEVAKKHKDKTIVLIEPDIAHLLLAFSFLDWTAFFEVPSIILLVQTPQETVIQVLGRLGLSNILHIKVNAWQNHNSPYYKDIETLIERNLQKENINLNTLEKFGKLWLKNSIKNIDNFFSLNGIKSFKNKFTSYSACVVAAGPTLEATLPYLKKINDKTIVICVDTALRACLRNNIEPDFIVLVDPQYWNARHIEGLQSQNSILITEIAAYPSVFRFKCKEKILCSSLYPLGKFLETKCCDKGTLSAGGSVASTAWDFARFIGCKTIYLTGVDFSFPNKNTHIKGSTFEEKNHYTCKRVQPNETMQINALYGAYPFITKDYEGNPLLSDKRMSLYAWWFESKCEEYKNIKTYSLSNKSISIKGITYKSIKDVLTLPNIEVQKKEILTNTLLQSDKYQISKTEILNLLNEDFFELKNIISEGLNLCKKIKNKISKQTSQNSLENDLKELNEIDKKITTNETKDILSLVFPTSRQLQELYLKQNLNKNPKDDTLLENILRTSILYKEILQTINIYFKSLNIN